MLQANSLRFSLAKTIAPAARSAATAGASSAGTQSASKRELAVVRRPAVAMQSLIRIGMLGRGPADRPLPTPKSADWPAPLAVSPVRVIVPLSVGSGALTRAIRALK